MRYGLQWATTLKDESDDHGDEFKIITCEIYKGKCHPREERLRALVYLGATYRSRAHVERVLEGVRIKPRMGDVRPHYWVWDALEVGSIPRVGDVWRSRFTES